MSIASARATMTTFSIFRQSQALLAGTTSLFLAITHDSSLFSSLAENHLRESKKTMALRQANSVSSIWTSFIGFTNSSITLAPTRLMSTSWVRPSEQNAITERGDYTVRLCVLGNWVQWTRIRSTTLPTLQHAFNALRGKKENTNAGLSQLTTPPLSCNAKRNVQLVDR